MHRHFLRPTTWALMFVPTSALTVTDPPVGECALLGWTPPYTARTSNLRLARHGGPLSAERALLGKPIADEAQAAADESIQIRPHPIEGSTALLGRP